MSEPAKAERPSQKAKPVVPTKGTAPIPKRAPESPAKPAMLKLRRALGELIAAHRGGSAHMVPVYAQNLRSALDAAVKLRGVATESERAELADIEPRVHKLLSQPTPTPAAPKLPREDINVDDVEIDWDSISDAIDQIMPGVGPAVTTAPQVLRDTVEAVLRSSLYMSTAFKEHWDQIKDHWYEFLVTTATLIAAEAGVLILAAMPDPTMVTKIAAVALQALLVAFAIDAVVSVSEAASAYSQTFWMNVESAKGDVKMINAAALNFARLIVLLLNTIASQIGFGFLSRLVRKGMGADPAGVRKPTTPESTEGRSPPKEPGQEPTTSGKDSTSAPREKQPSPEPAHRTNHPPTKNPGSRLDSLPEYRVLRSTLTISTRRSAHEWVIEIAAPLPDGSSKTVATGFAELDGGFPKGGPEFILRKNATVNGVEGMVQVYESGRVVSLTDIALDEAIAGFSREFGHPPDTLSGSLAWKNKLNFQRAYLTATQKGMGHQPAADWAIRQISFGRSRVERGYGELSVNATRLGEVDLGPDLGKHQVPTSIEITARRSRR